MLVSPGSTPGLRPPACRLLILAALAHEVRPFLRRIKARRRADLGLPAWEWGAGEGVVAVTGMGAAAARAAEHLLAALTPAVLLSVGFGGAASPDLAPGALVLGESLWRFEADPGQLLPVSAPAPILPLDLMVRRLRQANLAAFPGSLITTSRIIHKGGEGAVLQSLTHPVVDLETADLAEMAAAQGLAFVGLRAITDTAAEEIPEFLLAAGGTEGNMGPGTAFRWLLNDPRRLAALMHLWRRARLAAGRLAEALMSLLPLLLYAIEQLEGQPGEKRQKDKDPRPA